MLRPALQADLEGAVVLDAVPLHPPASQPRRDELLLILQSANEDRRIKLHAVCGGPRARITCTAARLTKDRFATGPRTDLLRRVLVNATCTGVVHPAGERILAFHFAPGGEGPSQPLQESAETLRLVCELFGPQGLWVLIDQSGEVLIPSRPVKTKQREFTRGDRYTPPPPASGPGPAAQDNRFCSGNPLGEIDSAFTEWDRRANSETAARQLTAARDKALAKLRHRAEGLERKLRTADDAPEIRQQADLLMAYGHQAVQGAPHLEVPDPEDPQGTLRIALPPDIPVRDHAAALYRRARKLEDGRTRTAEDLTKARAELADAEPMAHLDLTDPEARTRVVAWLQPTGLLPDNLRAPAPRSQGGKPGKRQQELLRMRRFTSREGLQILCGRTRQDNDRLSLKIARGNDLWFHVGTGYAGSHVVIRVPKNQHASLESLLDAATLAVHFSKARGGHDIEVIYTHAKHVRKRKGMPAGAVIPSQTRTLRVPHDPERLQRLLDTAPPTDDPPPRKGPKR